ncbi:MAG TPA: hypothetical protein VFE47_00505 [Tepidisphaeraceae bacterium]|jgi:hypothetical protein|nr:hypothetical protein [Tepidisphaeraceae bacterium]
MMTDKNQPTLLHYASPRGSDSIPTAFWRRSARRLSALWKQVPLPVAAVVLLLPVYLAQYLQWPSQLIDGRFGSRFTTFAAIVALFLPGALRRGNWRSLSFALAGASLATAVFLTTRDINVRGIYLDLGFDLAIRIIILLLLAVSETTMLKDRRWTNLAWLACAAIGAACIVSIVIGFLAGRRLDLHLHNGATENVDWGHFFAAMITAVVAWTMFAWASRAAAGKKASRKGFVAACSIAVAGWIGLFVVALPSLARRSVMGNGPFSRRQAIWMIHERAAPEDLRCVYAALDHADWSAVALDYISGDDWREYYVDCLADRDGSNAARVLSQKFIAHPHRAMADICAPLFVREKRYETVPLLLRYARMTDDAYVFSGSIFSDVCVNALEKMQVPQAADGIIQEQWVQEILRGHSPPAFDAATQNRLTRLLGTNAGADARDWESLYERIISTAPSPLSADQRKEADLVNASADRLFAAAARLQQAGVSMTAVAQPDVDVVTAEDFSREIDAYCRRVNDTIATRASNR